MSERVFLYDTTLRDGSQAEGVSFSAQDKVKIARRLDELEVAYIEGGYPGANPKDQKFFELMRREKLKHAKLCAFSMTRRKETRAEDDPLIRAAEAAGTPVVTLVGKTWDFHVHHALKTTPEENLAMISDSVRYFKKRKKEVVYDAEHFFDAYKSDRRYALRCLETAAGAGADWLVLCDTNGGTLPGELARIVKEVRKRVQGKLGIHCHDDAGCGVANSLAAVEQGVRQVQGTVNGIGERCGNANLLTILADLKLKMNYETVSDMALTKLTSTSRFVYEIANLSPHDGQPYVGKKAFAHKGGMHVSAVMQAPETYEHIRPELVGNRRRVLVSELSGKSNVLYKAREMGVDLSKRKEDVTEILQVIQKREEAGFQYEGAEASLWLLVKEILREKKEVFDLQAFRIIVEKRRDDAPFAEATIKVRVRGEEALTAAEGDGPVNALDNALRKALEPFYPQIRQIHLTDFKVRVLDEAAGTAAKVRVLIESADKTGRWSTIGVSENVIEASWQALADSIIYGLLREGA